MGKKRYIREQWTLCGDRYAEVDLFWITEAEHKAGPRRKKELASSLAQQTRNDWHSRRYFVQLINSNFTEAGFHVTLTYDDAFCPEDEQQAGRDVENYIRRVKWWLKKHGYAPAALRYIIVTEHQEEDKAAGLKEVRFHHHVLMQLDGMTKEQRAELRQALEDAWSTGRGDLREPLGRVNADRLQPDQDGLAALAGYLLKYPRRKKRWRQSRNLRKPVYKRPNDTKWSGKKLETACRVDAEDAYTWEQRFPGWRFLGAFPCYNEDRGEWRIYIRLLKKKFLWDTSAKVRT